MENGQFIGDDWHAWRASRIQKLASILGEEWFQGKDILELACGHGHVGRHLQSEYGANVTFTEGGHAFAHLENHLSELGAIYIDQDEPWDLGRKFDLVIHWGILYHLDNWQQDLRITLAHADMVCLESEVSDSDDPDYDTKVKELWYDGAANGIGSRPSPAHIERIVEEQGFQSVLYADADLNAAYHRYDWPIKNTGEYKSGQRRFWFLKKEKNR